MLWIHHKVCQKADNEIVYGVGCENFLPSTLAATYDEPRSDMLSDQRKNQSLPVKATDKRSSEKSENVAFWVLYDQVHIEQYLSKSHIIEVNRNMERCARYH